MKVKERSTKMTIAIIIAIVMAFVNNASAQSRGYMTSQIFSQGEYGPIVEVPQNHGGWVMWSNDGKTMPMSDGIQWCYLQDNNGSYHYLYTGTTGVAMSYTQYNQVVFNNEYSTRGIVYSFGMPCRMIQMRYDGQYI